MRALNTRNQGHSSSSQILSETSKMYGIFQFEHDETNHQLFREIWGTNLEKFQCKIFEFTFLLSSQDGSFDDDIGKRKIPSKFHEICEKACRCWIFDIIIKNHHQIDRNSLFVLYLLGNCTNQIIWLVHPSARKIFLNISRTEEQFLDMLEIRDPVII